MSDKKIPKHKCVISVNGMRALRRGSARIACEEVVRECRMKFNIKKCEYMIKT